MMDCISVENMRLSDAYTIANFVPSLELMRRAAYGVFKAAAWAGRIAIVVGSGNNGGDGFALAWILKTRGFDCIVFSVSRRMSVDGAHYAARAEEAGVPIVPFASDCLNGFDTVVDCLLGTGFQGTVRDNYRDAIEAINASNARVISVDINSGMNGDTGEAALAVKSHLTVTIGFVKTGLVTENAGRYMDRLVCADIGIRLIREEGKISPENCPPWLDRKILKSGADFEIVPMVTDADKDGKGDVHWKSWHETYTDLVDASYNAMMTREKCREIAHKWCQNHLVAKEGDRVIGYVGWQKMDDGVLINGLYVLADYHGQQVGYRLMNAALARLPAHRKIFLWVLKGNDRAIRFYQRCGFRFDGTEEEIILGTPRTQLRMVCRE